MEEEEELARAPRVWRRVRVCCLHLLERRSSGCKMLVLLMVVVVDVASVPCWRRLGGWEQSLLCFVVVRREWLVVLDQRVCSRGWRDAAR